MDALKLKIGEKQIELENWRDSYHSAITELGHVISGEVDPERLLVNLTEMSFLRAPEGQSPGMPATINGVPKCIQGVNKRAQELAKKLAETQNELDNTKSLVEALKTEIEKLKDGEVNDGVTPRSLRA